MFVLKNSVLQPMDADEAAAAAEHVLHSRRMHHLYKLSTKSEPRSLVLKQQGYGTETLFVITDPKQKQQMYDYHKFITFMSFMTERYCSASLGTKITTNYTTKVMVKKTIMLVKLSTMKNEKEIVESILLGYLSKQ